MHPAKSVIFFTTASGAGYGMLVWLALLAATGLQGADFTFGLVSFATAFGLIVSGLLSSTLHLGHPERAWRAMSQWRTSWLSREGLAALITFVPAGLFALSWVFLGANQSFAGQLGLSGAIWAVATVYCTAMIYGSLKTIPAWSTWWTRALYITMALMSGAIIVFFLSLAAGGDAPVWAGRTALFFIACGLAVQLLYWRAIDRAPAVSTARSATGLGASGQVSLLEKPHSEDNYLLKEMGFQIARKHAAKLRIIAMFSAFIVPGFLIFTALIGPHVMAVFSAGLATMSAATGVIIGRWLFFAEARHVVTLYYGETKV